MSQHYQNKRATLSISAAAETRRPILVWQAAKICGLSERAIRAAAATGRLPGFKRSDTPKLWRFWRSDVEGYRK